MICNLLLCNKSSLESINLLSIAACIAVCVAFASDSQTRFTYASLSRYTRYFNFVHNYTVFLSVKMQKTPENMVKSFVSSDKITIKIGLLGDSQIGKTSFMVRYIQDIFDQDYAETLGVNFMEKRINVKLTPQEANISDKTSNGNINTAGEVLISIWDFGGQQEYYPLMPLVCQDANCLFFCFDLTSKQSLFSVKRWYKEALKENKSFIPFLIGMKCDMFIQDCNDENDKNNDNDDNDADNRVKDNVDKVASNYNTSDIDASITRTDNIRSRNINGTNVSDLKNFRLKRKKLYPNYDEKINYCFDICKLARKFAYKMNAPFICCSSLEVINIRRIFNVAIGKCFGLTNRLTKFDKNWGNHSDTIVELRMNKIESVFEINCYLYHWREYHINKSKLLVDGWMRTKCYDQSMINIYIPNELVLIIKQYCWHSQFDVDAYPQLKDNNKNINKKKQKKTEKKSKTNKKKSKKKKKKKKKKKSNTENLKPSAVKQQKIKTNKKVNT